MRSWPTGGLWRQKQKKSGMKIHLSLIVVATCGMSGSSEIFHVIPQKARLSGNNSAHKMCFHYSFSFFLFSLQMWSEKFSHS
jgi:hypothetical protein